VNAPKVALHPHHRGSTMQLVKSAGGDIAAKPAAPPLKLAGDAARAPDRDRTDDFIQPRALFALMDDGQKQRLFRNIAGAMRGVPAEIIDRQIALFRQCDAAYAEGVADALKSGSLLF
jgi:catalase